MSFGTNEVALRALTVQIARAPSDGDEIACFFSENIFGCHAEAWEPREIRKLTASNRERVLGALRKAWKL